MAFNFPSGATNGQQYTADNGVVYIFDGNTNGVFIDLSKAPTGVAGEIT